MKLGAGATVCLLLAACQGPGHEQPSGETEVAEGSNSAKVNLAIEDPLASHDGTAAIKQNQFGVADQNEAGRFKLIDASYQISSMMIFHSPAACYTAKQAIELDWQVQDAKHDGGGSKFERRPVLECSPA